MASAIKQACLGSENDGLNSHGRIWIFVDDAVPGGCDLFDIAELRSEYSAEEYANLLMRQFIDDTASIFPLTNLQRCMVDSWDEWADDFKPFTARPLDIARFG